MSITATRLAPAITLRRLRDDGADRALVEQVHLASADFLALVSGTPPSADDVASFFIDLPPGKGYDDKFCLGVFDGDRLIGCADLIRGYPDDATAYVGLLLLMPEARGQGAGAAAFAALEAQARAWPGTRFMRLGVVATTPRARAFWLRMGFEPTGIVRPHKLGVVESTVEVFSKALA